MKKYITRILLIAILLCSMASLASCKQSNVISATINGETYSDVYLYEVTYLSGATNTAGYVYTMGAVAVGGTVWVDVDDGTKATVKAVIEEYPISVSKKIDTYVITYYPSVPTVPDDFDPSLLTSLYNLPKVHKSRSNAEKAAPKQCIAEISKKNVTVIYGDEESENTSDTTPTGENSPANTTPA